MRRTRSIRTSYSLRASILGEAPDLVTQRDLRDLLMRPSSGECAHHFQMILTKYPPQVTSRNTAAGWACHVHNQVNKSLDKEEFDCSKIGDFYDCGCADDEGGSTNSGSTASTLSDELVSSTGTDHSSSGGGVGEIRKKMEAPLPRLEKEE